MPPLEAAIAGNKVIGYSGGGGKEYWIKPIFDEVQPGNIKQFCEKILDTVNNFPKNWHIKTFRGRKKLIYKYSLKKIYILSHFFYEFRIVPF